MVAAGETFLFTSGNLSFTHLFILIADCRAL